jgi:hypothetical protein
MFFKRDLLLSQEYLAFVLLNLFDLFMTGWIFQHNGVEANGLAVWILQRYGLKGFVVFKFCLVAVVILACEGISLQSIKKSRIIITCGCIIYVFLVFYESYSIAMHLTAPPPTDTSRAMPVHQRVAYDPIPLA